jgi:hypothetical protein
MNANLIQKIEKALDRPLIEDELVNLKTIYDTFGLTGKGAESYLMLVAISGRYDLHERVLMSVGSEKMQNDIKKQAEDLLAEGTKQAGILFSEGTKLAKKTFAANLPKLQALLKKTEEAKVSDNVSEKNDSTDKVKAKGSQEDKA